MAFSSRKDDAGIWRLCLRKGPTFDHWCSRVSTDVEIAFAHQASAKACAIELNEKIWPAYEASRPARKRKRQPSPYWEALAIIHKHGGLTDAQLKEIEEWGTVVT
jgi:hypothetical protein